jgi:nitrogen regulatory protein P-II 1
MRRIQAVIRRFKLDDGKERLAAIGVPGMIVTEVVGLSKRGGTPHVFRGSAYVVDEQPLFALEIVANDADAPAIVRAIAQFARTGEPGDGIVYVTAVDDAVRIRTGEVGALAL